VLVADLEHDLVLLHGLVGAGDGFERHDGVVAIGERARVFVDVFGLLLADVVDAFGEVLVGDDGFGVGDGDAAVFAELEGRGDFEFRFELEGLAVVEVEVGYGGTADLPSWRPPGRRAG
jgi:hypothetical protein